MRENFLKWPLFEEDDINAVTAVLKSAKTNRWVGKLNDSFEKSMCERYDSKYSIALANGSLAIELALIALGMQRDDEVITTCRTFMASASSVVVCGGIPVVADVDLNSQNITAESIAKKITKKTKGIIAVHHAGFPCEMEEILVLAKEHNLFVIEDCAQAHGAKYKGKSVGSWGDINAWSYCQDKIISTGGEGGAVTTNSESLWSKAWSYKDHGKSYDKVFNTKHPEGFRWLIDDFGTNWRLTEMQCAIGLNALQKLPSWTQRRNENAKRYDEVLSKFDCVRITKVPEHIQHAYYKYYFFIESKALKSDWSRDRILTELNSQELPTFTGSCWNITAEEAFKKRGWEVSEKELPNAKLLGDTCLMLLTHPTLESADLDFACDTLTKVFSQAQK